MGLPSQSREGITTAIVRPLTGGATRQALFRVWVTANKDTPDLDLHVLAPRPALKYWTQGSQLGSLTAIGLPQNSNNLFDTMCFAFHEHFSISFKKYPPLTWANYMSSYQQKNPLLLLFIY